MAYGQTSKSAYVKLKWICGKKHTKKDRGPLRNSHHPPNKLLPAESTL